MSQRSPWFVPDVGGGDVGRLWLLWLVRLRWVALFAQVVTLSFTFRVLDGAWTLFVLAGVMVLLALANVWSLRVLGRGEPIRQGMLLWHLSTEVTALSLFLLLAGGPNNPFISLYLVHIAMAAVMLRPAFAIGLTAWTLLWYGAQRVLHLPLHLDRHTFSAESLTNLGEIMAFLVTTITVTGFILGLAEALRDRERKLRRAWDLTARTDRLRSVGTLAAGAAHELNTPLSTIGLRLRRIGRRHDDEPTVKDVGAITSQLSRCKDIVDRLLIGAGDPSASELVRAPLAELVQEALALWGKGTGLSVDFEDRSEALEVEVPRIAFSQALINLLENARQAQDVVGNTDPLQVRTLREAQVGVVTVRDHGCGLPDEPDRIGEPFFTTKDDGTGLGVFVARAVADGAGGGLRYLEEKGASTEARWWFLEAPRRTG